MKLSQAIRKGIELSLPGFGGYFAWSRERKEVHACAIGAALIGICGIDALKGMSMMDREDALDQQWPFLRGETPDEDSGNYWCAIIKRNDFKKISREEIADWLEERGY
jgi:hypothetical protein